VDGAQQKYGSRSDIPGQWWAVFRWKALKDLVERAIRDNPDLKAGQAALAVAAANVEVQRGGCFLLPRAIIPVRARGRRQRIPRTRIET
jgi:outer membrane protein TolC